MNDETAQQRTTHLAKLSGLEVYSSFDHQKGEYIFEFFGCDGVALKTVYSYAKAKMFAEGFRIGYCYQFLIADEVFSNRYLL